MIAPNPDLLSDASDDALLVMLAETLAIIELCNEVLRVSYDHGRI